MVIAAGFNLDSNEAKAYIAIAVGICGLAYLYLRSMSKKRRDPLERAPFAGLSQQRSVEREFQNLLVEMAEMTRQISAQLDTRSQKLDLLIIEADKKIAELRRLQAVAPAEPCSTTPIRSAEEVAAPALNDVSHLHTDVYDLVSQGLSTQDIARQLNRPRGEIELILALRSPAERPARIAG